METTTTDKKSKATFSKKRYNDFVQKLHTKYDDVEMINDILTALCDAFNYDPTLNTYDEAQSERIKARRERLRCAKRNKPHI